MLVLDTDHLSFLERIESQPGRVLRARLDRQPSERVVSTVISYEEQTRGWMAEPARSTTLSHQIQVYRRLLRQLEHYKSIPLFPFDESAAAHFQALRKARLRIGTMDLKIASIALAHDATLLTRNLADFGKVPGLRVEDWTA